MSERCAFCLDAPGAIRVYARVFACRPCAERDGTRGRKAIARHEFGDSADNYTPEVLAKLAAGGIMDASALFLPAGKLSMAECREREARILRGEQP